MGVGGVSACRALWWMVRTSGSAFLIAMGDETVRPSYFCSSLYIDFLIVPIFLQANTNSRR